MKRFNCKNGPVEMVECDKGYWVKYEDAQASTNAYRLILDIETHKSRELGDKALASINAYENIISSHMDEIDWLRGKVKTLTILSLFFGTSFIVAFAAFCILTRYHGII